jgi:hypothetical protein
MSRPIATSLVVMLIATMPATARIAREEVPATSEINRTLIGLPIVTADGETVGYVTEVGIDEGQAIVIGEIVRPLGIGYDAVAIPIEMFANKGDHVELAITAEQVRSRLQRPEK